MLAILAAFTILPTCGDDKPQVSPTPRIRYNPKGPDRDCAHFRTHAEAQAFFVAAGGPRFDPHRLDRDRDGIACELLP